MDLEVIVVKFKADDGGAFAAPEILLEYVEQLHNFFSGTLDPSKIDYYLGLLFPESVDEGLLGFLRKKVTEKRYDKVKEHILNLIHFVLVQKEWRQDVSRFCLRFKATADIYWRNIKEAARIQQIALDCLITVFENFGNSLDLVELDASPLYWNLLPKSERSKYQPTVRGKMFTLMGVLAALGQKTFMQQEGCFKQLFNHMTSSIKAQVESSDSHLEVSILHGCLKGIDKILHVYVDEIDPEDASWILFQEHLEQIADPSCSIVKGQGKAKIKRREFQRAALELVANHGDRIERGLFKKYRQWFEDLLIWSKSPNADDNRIGRKAMYRFLETVVRYSEQVMKDSNSRNDVENLYQFFTKKFKEILGTTDANKIELGIAIRGFGMLSSLCAEGHQTKEMLNLIMQHIEIIIHELDSPIVDKYGGSLPVLSTYLESVASILPSLEIEDDSPAISEQQLESIKKLTVLLIKFYPDLGEGQRNFCYISVQKLFDSLWNHHHTLCEPFIEQVYQQSLLNIVSCPTRAEMDILIESWNKSHPESKKSALSQLGLKPVTSYVKFWKLLLHRGTLDSDTLKFDLLMQWMLTTIGKLDLTIKFEENEISESSLDPMQGATATVLKDFQIFVNMVDFFREIMSENEVHLRFVKWVRNFSDEMLAYIRSHAYVSGFYKILAIVFEVARNVGYFDKDDPDTRNLQIKLNRFFRSLGSKIREFRDDLLLAVLELWLSLPDALILSNSAALNRTLQSVFITGKNSFSLAIRGLEAIQRWFARPEFPAEEIEIIMNSTFPILQTYFVHSEDIKNLGGSTTANNPKLPKPQKSDLKYLIKKNFQASQKDEDPTLKEIQLKILQVIGLYGQFIRLESNQHSGLSKDQRFLKYKIPFQDCKPEFYLDDLLPTVLELCENAVERQTKISACEFFHTISLIFIGRSRDGVKYDLFKRIFQSILKLGCDSDILVRQLFNPLCLQTIHWFSKKHSPYGDIVLDILTDKLAQHDDLSLRELAAVCVGEYFAWSLKHSSPSSKNVVKTIFAMSTHVSPDFRQASVLAFNSIYRDFREDNDLTSEFTFNLLYSFLTSLQLSKDLPDDSLLVTSTKQSIKHLERILSKKKDRFNTALKRQFKPGASTGTNPCLQDVVEWLLNQGGSSSRIFREECLRLIPVLARWIKGCASAERFLVDWEQKNNWEKWIEIAEKSKTNDEDCAGRQLTFLDASSDFYNFLFSHNILKKTLFCSSSSTFCSQLLETSTSSANLSDDEKHLLVKIFSKLKFAWELFDSASLVRLWNHSMELSKLTVGESTVELIPKLVEVWGFGEPTLSMKSLCQTTFYFEPDDIIHHNDQSVALYQSIWYRAVAEGGLMVNMLENEQLLELREKLWTSVTTSIFKRSVSTSGQGWEASNLSMNQNKIIENIMVTALCVGLDQEYVIDAVFDATSITRKDGSFQLVVTKGQVFQKELIKSLIYCDRLLEFDTLLQRRSIKDVGELIQRILELLKSHRVLRKKFGHAVFEKAIGNWNMISINCDIPTTVKIFNGLLAVDIDVCKNSEELFNWWSGHNLIRARHLDLKGKAEVFGYANVFSSSRKTKVREALIQTICNLVENELNPTDTPWADVEQYVSHIFQRTLKIFEQLPTNLDILTPVLLLAQKVSEWLMGRTDHFLFRLIKETIEKVISELHVTDSDRVKMVSDMYIKITSNDTMKLLESTAVWKCCLLPAVSSLRIGATKSFFKKHIYDILTKTEIQAKTSYDWNTKSLAVYLLELLVYQTNADFIKGAELSTAYLNHVPPDKKSQYENKTSEEKVKLVYQGICKVCVSGVTQNITLPDDDDNLRKCILSCHEAFYSTLSATLLVTKAEFKFFDKLLFPGKKLFENIVDNNMVYEFPIIIDETRHKAGVFSRRAKKSATTSGDSLNLAFRHANASGNLTGSSLAPEAATYDFTTSVTVANTEYYQRIFGNISNKTGGRAESEVTLEWSEINQHGCMFAFVEILNKMGEFCRDKKDVDRKWVTTVARILSDNKVHKNVKVFLVGGILNSSGMLESLAAELIPPIIQLVLTDCFGSVKWNHFVQDVIITLLSWHKTAVPEESLVKNLLNYMIGNLKHEEIVGRKDVFYHTMEIFQNVIKFWVTNDSMIPSNEIMSLQSGDESSSIMLDVCLNVLLGARLPQKEVGSLTKTFIKACNSRFKTVYTTGAKCLGILLRKIKANASESDLQTHVTAISEKVLVPAKSKPSVFVEILSAIQIHFPEMMVYVRDTIMELSQRPKLRPELLVLLPLLLKQQICEASSSNESFNESQMLELESSPEQCADVFFIDIDGRGFFQHHCNSEVEITAALDLMELLIGNMTQCTKLLKMIDWLKFAESSPNKEIRSRYAQCLVKLYEKLQFSKQDISMDSADSVTRRLFLKVFVRMYSDEEHIVKDVVNKFWEEVLSEWNQSSELLLELLELVGHEENPLHACLGLMLQRCSLSPDFKTHIFDEPLENCQFHPFQLDTSWRLRHASFQPLFAESLSSVQNFSTLPRVIQSSLLSQRRTSGRFGMNVLRATLANLQFTPTQQDIDDSIDGMMEVEEFDNFQFQMNPVSNSIPGDLISDNQTSTANPVLKLRRKFYEKKDSSYYATKMSERRSERLEQVKDIEKTRISGVKTVRSYRIGELPDILIRHSDLLNTLTKLAKMDPKIGNEFLVRLYTGIYMEMDKARCIRKFRSKSKDVFDRVLRNSASSTGQSLSLTLLELAVSNNISIPSTMTLEICSSNHLQKLGILKLEDSLNNDEDNSSTKRSRLLASQQSHREEVWLGIAKMYKEIEEYDVLRNIFNTLKGTVDGSRKIFYQKVGEALHDEGQGLLDNALATLDDALPNDDNAETSVCTASTKAFLEDSIMHCLTKLGDWSSLYTISENFNAALTEDILQDQNTLERLLPVKVMAGMQLGLRTDDSDEEINNRFNEFMLQALTTEEGTGLLTARFPFDVGAWLLLQDEDEYFAQANLMLEKGYELLRRKLREVKSLPLKHQKQIIVSLQQASVINDFLKWKKGSGKELKTVEREGRYLVEGWNKCLAHQPIDLLGCNLIVGHRDCFASKVGVTLESLGAQDDTLLKIQKFRVDEDLWLANLGVLHRNSTVSHRSLAQLKNSGREEIEPLEFRKSMARFLSSFHDVLPKTDWCKRWCSMWKKLDKIQVKLNVDDIKADLLHSILEVTSRENDEINSSIPSIIKALGGDTGGSTVASCVLNVSEKLLSACNRENFSTSVSLYTKLFHLLKKFTDDCSEIYNQDNAEKMLLCLLRGCSGGNANEILLLSNLFILLKKFPSLNASFEEMVKDVPSYMFLPWIDQIVTSHKTAPQQYSCFKSLIQRMALDFPQAFQLQYPEYLTGDNQLISKAFGALVLPFKMHESMVGRISSFGGSEDDLIRSLCEFQAILQEIINNNGKIYGEYHIDYAMEMFNIVNKTVAENQKSSGESSEDSQRSGSRPASQNESLNRCRQEMIDMHTVHTTKVRVQKLPVIKLEKLSPILAEFHFFDYDTLEKPGLYADFKRPRVEEHAQIVSFQPTVQQFTSVTRPLRFTIICNDGKKSNFLAKLGDDLRQDRRIQQLFKMSNILFQQDDANCQRNLNIVTYSCIPLTAEFGLIEMVDNVLSLSDVTFDEPELKNKRSELIRSYETWVVQSGDQTKSLSRYKKSAQRVGRTGAEGFFNKMSSSLPRFMLCDNIKQRTNSLQDFFTIRQDLIRSYGAMCMVHWLLGIGDRHLENCLLSMNSGKLIGIDFGRAFGTSNIKFPVPEMVPFRLTPQIQDLMMPYTYNGMFRESCIVAWKCLVNASTMITTVADVFIQEPSIDWLKIRHKPEARPEQNDEDIEMDTSTNSDWIPMEIMKRKLLGHNPTNLLLDELKMQLIDGICDTYSKIVNDGRIHTEKEKLSTEEYIDVLLNIATDRNILCRIFSGWNSWV